MTIEFTDEMGVELVTSNASDEMVIWTARVSTQGERSDVEIPEPRKDGLIRYLMKNRHASPFEHSSFTFRLSVPIFVAREVYTHRMSSRNEWSARYSEMIPKFYVPSRERPLQQIGKPAHYELVPGTDSQFGVVAYGFENSYKASWETYVHLLQDGVAREVARDVLPVGIYTVIYFTVNARSLMNLLSLRIYKEDASYPSHALYEIEQMAAKMETFFAEAMPYTHKAWNEFGRVSV